VPVVVVGVTTHQGERESRSQGEGAQVLAIDNDGEVRVMRNAATALSIIHYEHWRAGCPEIVRRLTRRWIAPAGGRGSGGGDLWDTHPT
jgi:hypothetical protein